jgi:hypothetical protein
VLKIGTKTIVSTILARSALNISKERRTNLTDQSLAGINKRKSLLNIFVRQTISVKNYETFLSIFNFFIKSLN